MTEPEPPLTPGIPAMKGVTPAKAEANEAAGLQGHVIINGRQWKVKKGQPIEEVLRKAGYGKRTE